MNVRLYVGIVPIFIGYALLCVTVFWNDRHYFPGFADTCYTLFAMMNGDSILDNFHSTSGKNFFLGQLTMYSFVFISICVWQNMNLVIIEDAYMNVKYKSAHSWLTGDDEGED